MADKSSAITPGAERSTVSRAVRFITQGKRAALGLMTATAFAGGTAEALFLVTVTRAAFAITDGDDEVGIVAGRTLPVNQTLLLAFALVLVRIGAAASAAWQSADLSTAVVSGLRTRLARAFLDSEWEIQQGQQAGSLQEFFGTYSNQAAFLMGALSAGLVALANLIALLALAVVVDPVGALVMAASVVVLSALLRPVRSAVRRRARQGQVAGMEMAVSVNEVSQLGMELHVFHVQNQAADRLAGRIERVRKTTRSAQFAGGLSAAVYAGLAYIALLAALGVVALSSAATLTSVGAVMLVMLRSLSYGQALQGAHVGASGAAPAIDELVTRLDLFEHAVHTDGGQPVGSIGSIVVDNVTFAYSGDQDVLRDISFDIKGREIIGVVGPSGGGKSTLVQLLLGLREPQQGCILVDGRDIRALDKTEWSRKITFVPQSARLIAGTITDNIRFLRDGVSADQVERAARLAHLHDDIVGFADGYERQVGELGGHLSGGQQQRLCIARALVENPDVLILDEPTSALDVRSEHLVRETLLGLKQRMTVIVIAHRLSTLEICDRIMVIQGGELKGFDTPLELEQSSDFYREALELSGMRQA